MFRRFRRELGIFRRYPGVLAAAAFLGAFGGILLWVNGTAAPLVYRMTNMPKAAPGFTLCFLLWLAVYGLAGFQIGCALVPPLLKKCGTLRYAAVSVIVYTLLLAWYPLFFSIVHGVFACIVLLLSIGLQLYFFFALAIRVCTLILPACLLLFLEGYFFVITFLYILAN